MTTVIVDTSVYIACAISDGKARRAFFAATNVEFFAPEFVLEELRHRMRKIIALSGEAPTVLSALIDDLFARTSIVPREGFAHRLREARKLTVSAGAPGDEDYVALALTLRAPIWTYDNDFHRMPAIRVVIREQIETVQVR